MFALLFKKSNNRVRKLYPVIRGKLHRLHVLYVKFYIFDSLLQHARQLSKIAVKLHQSSLTHNNDFHFTHV